MDKKIKISILLNAIIVVLVIFGTISMFTGFEFMGHSEMSLTSTKIEMFKFFTVDSNILMGIISLIFLIKECKMIKNNEFKISKNMAIWKLVGTVGVTLTFLTTAFYLAPFAPYGYFSLFLNANLFFHLVVPLLSIISFAFLENNEEISFRESFLGMIPMLIYAIFYIVNVIVHFENGDVPYKYDFYGFVKGDLWTISISAGIMIFFTFLISLSLWGINKKLSKKGE